MLAKYYIIKMRPINIYNLLIAHIFENSQNLVFGPCDFDVNSNGLLTITPGVFTLSQCDNPNQFRYIDWSTSTLEMLSPDKSLVFGTYRDDQIKKLKNYFTDKIISVGITYSLDSYAIALTSIVKNHIAQLQNGIISPNSYDADLLSVKSDSELINHYFNEFDKMNLLPSVDSMNCDYNIDVSDFFNKDKMAQHLCNLGFPCNTSSLYDRWLLLNS